MVYVDGTIISSNDQQAAAVLETVRKFLGTHGTALAHAAYLLGGGAASGSVFRLVEGIRNARLLSRAHIRCLERIYTLLVLENVGAPDRLETELFVEIIPDSRAVEEISLLADTLNDLLVSIGEREEIDSQREGFCDAA